MYYTLQQLKDKYQKAYAQKAGNDDALMALYDQAMEWTNWLEDVDESDVFMNWVDNYVV